MEQCSNWIFFAHTTKPARARRPRHKGRDPSSRAARSGPGSWSRRSVRDAEGASDRGELRVKPPNNPAGQSGRAEGRGSTFIPWGRSGQRAQHAVPLPINSGPKSTRAGRHKDSDEWRVPSDETRQVQEPRPKGARAGRPRHKRHCNSKTAGKMPALQRQ